ncbi:MBL fold metallo-hydrolase [Amycolatopsis alkalitolerans]|uniref:MBL fold metallo-hydrolase n=1 Tax=Amycolatopsis alkalitolerans TaxID=2547244 RepID=A0A5C4LZ66_9PSEU|nr:MBL fold metallo-hydrolase [Amycolatopsis alkalitolerans]TNC22503.1 MBL fold metallo-hydrolase [Amycolatopsis alkalitolerans]
MSEELRVTFVGGPTALLEIAGKRLLTDPTFSPAGDYETAPGRTLTKTEGPAVPLESLEPLDAVLLSHDQHADNLDPAGRELVGRILLTLTTVSGARRLGGTAQGLPPWSALALGQLEVIAVPAQHGPKGAEGVVGEVTGFVLRGRGLPSVYISGDNASLEQVRAIARRVGSVDVALLFAGAARTSLFDGAPLTLTSEAAAEATRILNAKIVIPVHTRGWAHFTEGPDAIRKAFANAGLSERLRVLEPGESIRLATTRGS